MGTTTVAKGFEKYLEKICRCSVEFRNNIYDWKEVINEGFANQNRKKVSDDERIDCIIYDMRNVLYREYNLSTIKHFHRCYAVGSLVPWKQQDIYNVATALKEKNCMNDIRFIITAGGKEDIREFESYIKNKVFIFPYTKDVENISKELTDFYYGLL